MNFSNFFSSFNFCSFSFHTLKVLAIAHSLNSKYMNIIFIFITLIIELENIFNLNYAKQKFFYGNIFVKIYF